MTTKAAITSDGAGRARRWLSRALVVIGGAIAATAIAWLVSTAGASASTQHELSHVGTESVGEAADTAASGIGDTLSGEARQQTDGEHRSSPDLSRNPIAFGDGTPVHEVKDSVDRFWKDRVSQPFGKTVDTVTGLVRTPPEPADLGKDFWKTLRPGGNDLVELPDLPALPDAPAGGSTAPATPGSASGGEATADAGTSHAGPTAQPAQQGGFADRSADRPAPEAPAVGNQSAGDSGGSTPTAPVRLPANTPSLIPAPAPGGTSGGPHLDGPLFGIPANSLSAFDSAVVGSVRPGVRHLPTQPGSQPGVTPD